jgi:hypothetical protein
LKKTSGEKRWILIFGGIFMLITTIPYWTGYARQGESWRFTGTVLGVEDSNSYLANMVSGSSGAWLFRTPYTPYPQQATLVFLPYLLLGKLAAQPGLHDQMVVLFHIFRILAGLLAVWATYDFIAYFIRSVRWRRFGTVLAVAGGGLGYLLPLTGHIEWMGSLPVEFYSPEAFGFLMFFSIPHLALARAFLLWGLRAFLIAGQKRGKSLVLAGLGTGVLWLLTALAQPLTGMLAGAIPVGYVAITGAWQLARQVRHTATDWRQWRAYWVAAVLAGVVAGPYAAYNALSFLYEPLLKAWSDQSTIPAAHPWLYVLAYGLILPFSLLGAWRLLRKDGWMGIFLVSWAVVFSAAIYIPFSLQRRLNEGVWVALLCMACLAFEWAEENLKYRLAARWVTNFVMVFSMPATALILAGCLLIAVNPARPAFIPSAEARAFESLAGQVPTRAVVLCAPTTGNPLPAWAPVRVVVGIGTLSANYSTLAPQIEQFFQTGQTDASRQAFLDDLGVNYIFWGPDERALGSWDPHTVSYLRQVFSHEGYTLFEYLKAQ